MYTTLYRAHMCTEFFPNWLKGESVKRGGGKTSWVLLQQTVEDKHVQLYGKSYTGHI